MLFFSYHIYNYYVDDFVLLSVVAVIVTICPTENTADESLCSLYFAQRLRNIEMGVAQRKITVRNNAVEADALREKLNLTTWRKRLLLNEELRAQVQKKEEEHGKREVRIKNEKPAR